jgi:membrane associated rhomboid family serine protease
MSSFRFSRIDKFPPIVKNLIIINCIVWVAQLLLNDQFQLTRKIELWPLRSPEFKPYQVVTHMFAHVDIMHLAFNMFSFWFFGRVLEGLWQAKRFLFFYLACGIGATVVSMVIQYIQYDSAMEKAVQFAAEGREEEVVRVLRQVLLPSLGASGAVMGVVIAFGYLFPNTELMGLIPIPIKVKWLVLMWVAADLFGGISNSGKGNIGHFAHLGGALTGFLIVLYWNKTNRKTLY